MGEHPSGFWAGIVPDSGTDPALIRIPPRWGRSRRGTDPARIAGSGDVDGADDLVDRGDVVGHEGHRLVAHRAHALGDGERARISCGGAAATTSWRISSVTSSTSYTPTRSPVAGVRAVVAADAADERRPSASRRGARTAFALVGGRLVRRRRTTDRSGARVAGRRPRRATTPPGTARCPCRSAGTAPTSRRWRAATTSRRGRSSADCTAIRAVSSSRISPTRMTSGSWRRIDFSPLANVTSARRLICIWLTAGNTYSTGSSIVITLSSLRLISASVAYSVVVLPEPVGPLHTIIP